MGLGNPDLATINVVYGALIAMVQTDFKYVIGFSSVSHMGLVLIGFATLNSNGLLGAGMQMFSHGVMTALFFAIVGMVYDRAHTRDIPQLGGLVRKMPFAAVGFIIAGLVSMGMPFFSGFAAEFPDLGRLGRYSAGCDHRHPGVIITAATSCWSCGGYSLARSHRRWIKPLEDISLMDKIVVVAFRHHDPAGLVPQARWPGWFNRAWTASYPVCSSRHEPVRGA